MKKELNNKTYKVGDHGLVRILELMGDDESIVASAKVINSEYREVSVLRDLETIRYLMRHNMMHPFGMACCKLFLRVPKNCWRHWTKNMHIQRIEKPTPTSCGPICKQTSTTEWRLDAPHKATGDEYLTPENSKGYSPDYLSSREFGLHAIAAEVFEERVSTGVDPYQACKDMPESHYLDVVWKSDLDQIFEFLLLHKNSTREVSDYCDVISTIVREWVPACYAAFLDNKLHSISLSRREIGVLALLNANDQTRARELAESYGWFNSLAIRERKEFQRKILALKLENMIPWQM